MNKESLIKRYEPQTLREVVGQKEHIHLLKMHMKEKIFPSPLIIAGVPGIGKTSVAKILARTFVCENPRLNDEGYYDPCPDNEKCTLCKTVSPKWKPNDTGAAFVKIGKNKGSYQFVNLRGGEINSANYEVLIIENSDFLLDKKHPAYGNFIGYIDNTDKKLILTVNDLPTVGKNISIDTRILSRSTFLSFYCPSVYEIVERLIFISESEKAKENVVIPQEHEEEFYSHVLPAIAKRAQLNVRGSIQYLELCLTLQLWTYKLADAYFKFSFQKAG